MIHIGILGTGFGIEHLKQYQKIDNAQVTHIFGRNKQKLQEIEAEYSISVTDSIDEVLSSPDIELVDICLPTALHAEYISKCLKCGKDVICETPLSYSLEDALKIESMVNESDNRLFTNLFIKFSPPHAIAIEKIKTGSLGKILTISAHQKTPPHWGDMNFTALIQELARHNIDFITELLGEPESVSAFGFESSNSHLFGSLLYKNSFAQFECSTLVPATTPFCMGFDITGENGRIIFEGAYGKEVIEKITLYTDEQVSHLTVPAIKGHPEVIRKVLSYVTDCIENDTEDNLLNFNKAFITVKTANSVLDDWNKRKRQ